MLVRNPYIWLRRFRHRKGYGVHSPFAYDFITQVLYSPGRYYAYDWLDLQLPAWQRLLPSRRKAVDRLLMRLTNCWQPSEICAPSAEKREWSYLHQGCKRSVLLDKLPEGKVGFLYLQRPEESDLQHLYEGSMLVIDNLRKNKDFWKKMKADERTRVTFDLYDIGIVIFDNKLQRQDYIVNW